MSLFLTDGVPHFFVPNTGSFFVESHQVKVHPINRQSITPYLLGRVLGLWLEMQGLPLLHGSCLCLGRKAVGLLGQSGMGKSTFSAAILKAGHQLISDDLLPLEAVEDGWQVAPGIQQLRIWPDSGHYFFPNYKDFQRVHPDYLKRKVDPGDCPAMVMAGEPGMLQALVILVRMPSHEPHAPKWEQLHGAGAMVQLIANSYNVEALQALGWQKRRLHRLAAVAETVPIWQLTYPSGFAALPALVAEMKQRWG